MDVAGAQELLDWLAAYPAWAVLIIFIIAFCEGLIGAGLIVPGATMLFTAGGFVGTGHLPLWPSLVAAFSGALLGDSASYGLGRRYGQRLRSYWPLRNHPHVLARGDALFAAHGGKALVIGRFIGPVRGIAPAIAGMMRMPPGRFFLVTFLVGFPWAPAYLLPGAIFGASLAVAGSVALRLVALVLVGLLAAWVAWWVAARLVAPRLRRLTVLLAWQLRRWSTRRPCLGHALAVPRRGLRAFQHPGGRPGWVLVAVLMGLVLWQAGVVGPSQADELVLGLAVSQMDAGLRSWLALPALLLEPLVWSPAWLVATVWLAWGARWRWAGVVALAVPGAALLALLLQAAAGGSLPPPYPGAPPSSFRGRRSRRWLR